MYRELWLDRLDEFPPCMGGRTCLYGGYVWEFQPGHHLQNKWGWVAQHRLVAEQMLGRRLIRSRDEGVAEAVHHKDEVRTNNRPDNLEVMTRVAHRRRHAREAADRQMARLTKKAVAASLVGRTIREAANHLGTTHMTLRRRWPELVASRKRRAPCDVADPKWPALIAPLAANPDYTIKQSVKLLGISALPLRRICRTHGIAWIANKSKGRTGRPKGSKNKRPRRRKPTAENGSETALELR